MVYNPRYMVQELYFLSCCNVKAAEETDNKCKKETGNHFGPLASGSIALFCVWFMQRNMARSRLAVRHFLRYVITFSFILVGSIIEPFVISAAQKLHIRLNLQALCDYADARTFIIVCIGEMFFQCTWIKSRFEMLGKFDRFPPSSLWNGTLFKLELTNLIY